MYAVILIHRQSHAKVSSPGNFFFQFFFFAVLCNATKCSILINVSTFWKVFSTLVNFPKRNQLRTIWKKLLWSNFSSNLLVNLLNYENGSTFSDRKFLTSGKWRSIILFSVIMHFIETNKRDNITFLIKKKLKANRRILMINLTFSCHSHCSM